MTGFDIIITGAGPAGISVAIQLKRYGFNPLILEKNTIGGLIKNANLLENYPGFPKGISGIKFAELLQKQIKCHQINILFETALKIDYKDESFFIKTNKENFRSDIAIVAAGTKPKELSDIPISTKARKNIFYEVHPISNISGERVAIVGGGDAAFDYAENLSKRNDIIILSRGIETRCLPLLQRRTRKNNHIRHLSETLITRVKYLNGKLILICSRDEKKIEISSDKLLIAIGRNPNLDFLGENLKKNMKKLQKKRIFYMIGDVKNGDYRQVSVAAGDGIVSAMKIYERFKNKIS